MQRRPVSLRKSVPVTAREVILTGHNLKTNLKSMSFPAALLSVHVQARQETLKTYLIENLKPAFERDVKILERWIAAGHIRPVDPKHLFFTIWAATQTYADFSTQIQLLLGKPALEQDDFNEATEFLCNFVLSALDAQH